MLYFLKKVLYNSLAVSMTELGYTPFHRGGNSALAGQI